MDNVPGARAPQLLRATGSECEPGWVEWLAIPLVLLGGPASLIGFSTLVGTPNFVLVPGVGWLSGVLLLWLSRIWPIRDKLIGTLIFPGGLLGAVYLTFTSVSVERCPTAPAVGHCTGGISTGARVALIALWVILVAGPIATSFHLARRLRTT